MPNKEKQPRRRGETVRRAVLDAAAEELINASVDHVTIADIAARAGVHETSIYRRWVTKEALLLETAQEQTLGSVPQPDTGSLRGDLVALVLSLDAFLRSAVGGALLRLALTAATVDGVSARESFWTARLTSSEVLLERARSRGELRPDAPADLLIQALVGSVHMAASFGSRGFDRRRAEELVDLMLTGAGTS